MPDRVAVTSADFIRNIGYWQNEALRRPVSITHHGRERLVLASPDEFSAVRLDPAPVQADGDAETTRALTAVCEHMEEGYLVLDGQLRLKQCNTAAEAFFARNRAELIDAAVIDIFPQPIASILNDRIQTVKRARNVERFDAASFDGRALSVAVWSLGEDIIVLFQNTTERRIQRQRFEEHEAVQKAARGHPRIVTIRLDSRARITWVDDKFGELTGFDCTDLLGHRFVDLLSPSKRREVAEMIERVLSERTVSQTLMTFLGRYGGEFAGQLALAPVLSDYVAQGVACMFVSSESAATTRLQEIGRASA